MDFFRIQMKETKSGSEIYPNFVMRQHSEDLMIRGGKFYAIWDEQRGLWSQSEFDVQRLVDEELQREAEKKPGGYIRWMSSFETGSWEAWKKVERNSPDQWHPLDNKLIFSNTEVKKTDYASKRLPYAIGKGDIPAWTELVDLLYAPEEKHKFEWAIGSVVAGDSRWVQKFLVFYGKSGVGKSTILNIIERLFEGYYTVFDGKALGSSNGQFATAAFKNHPLVAIQHDTDLSRIEDNARLNSIISHEMMPINEKYRTEFPARIDAMLFMASNQPVKISDAKSGILRRLIDVNPTGTTHPVKRYNQLMAQIKFELGAIAAHCLEVYHEAGANYYDDYRPTSMMLQTDPFYNFILDHHDIFKAQEYTTLNQAWKLYQVWCDESGVAPRPKYKLKGNLDSYFLHFHDRKSVDGAQTWNVYEGFVYDKFKVAKKTNGTTHQVVLESRESRFDKEMASQLAQLAGGEGYPAKPWGRVRTKLKNIDTSDLHYVQVPDGHIVIDFDLTDSDGAKSLERNLEAASHWPPTYAEISKGGNGVHLHYTYEGDSSKLASLYAPSIEILTYPGDASLRRRLSWCNDLPIATISSGLPLKKQEKMLKSKTIKSEKGLRELIERNLRKEIHPGTKPSVDFIKKVLDDAYESGMKYDVSDLKTRLTAFANNSSNQTALALKTVREMKLRSEDEIVSDAKVEVSDDRLAFFDIEAYPNLFVVCWKFAGDDHVVTMVNPQAFEIEQLFKLKLVGFYNRRFDNHLLYAASMGASPEQLYNMGLKLIEGNRSATFGQAYNLSYADVWDFSSEKMGLKKFEIKLGILHLELDLPWDAPVDEKDWPRVVEYCANDVRATEAVFNDRKGDFVARQILAELSGLTVNDTTQAHTAKIIFGSDRHPQQEFIYTDLSIEFPGYEFEQGKSHYKGEEPGEGGYVYAEPGMYENVVVMDVVSMHPRTIEILDLFGPYTKNFSDLLQARIAIKRGDYQTARKMLDGRLKPFLIGAEDDPMGRHGTDLAYALRIALNIVYGLTSAKFDNPFRDIRNVDNIVAKRGALFMIDLKEQLRKQGHPVVHIKTDSVKIPGGGQQAMTDVKTIGSFYKYDFDHEETYDKFCLVNDAVYVGGVKKVPWDPEYPRYDWTAVGAQFQHPYVFKALFSGEEFEFKDFCEARSVIKGAMYLDLLDHEEPVDRTKMRHVGRTGLFVPVLEGGGALYRVHEDKYFAVSGTKGHRWMEAHVAQGLGDQLKIDMSYFQKLSNDAITTIEKFGSFSQFVER